jgi:hypothetical protein
MAMDAVCLSLYMILPANIMLKASHSVYLGYPQKIRERLCKEIIVEGTLDLSH